MRRVAATVGVLAVLAAMPTFAWVQATNSGAGVGPSLQAAQPSAQKNVAPTVEHLLSGDTKCCETTSDVSPVLRDGQSESSPFARCSRGTGMCLQRCSVLRLTYRGATQARV